MHLSTNHTLTQIIQLRAHENPQRIAIVFLKDDGREEIITAGEFHTSTVNYALALESIEIGQEDLVILVLPHSPELLFAFWGAMYLGAISSIFPFLTEKLDPEIYKQRVRELVSHSKARAVITFPGFKAELSALLADVGCTVLSTEDVAGSSIIEDWPERDWTAFSPEKIAFLQHSSGTTGLQKGVALSHRSVISQIIAYSSAIELQPNDVIVSWLPLYHDMGLIAGFVLPLITAVTLVLMSPFKWVRDPKILLHTIDRHRGTLCWLPNFAYNHSARAIRQRDIEARNLSSMRAFINCSEPVYKQSHQVFFDKFAAYGLRAGALSTCYAMAENTFAVTQHRVGEPAKIDWVNTRSLQEDRFAMPAGSETSGATPMVSCGQPILGTEIIIVDERGAGQPERRVGEIALRSNCMLSGYFRRPDLSAESIREGWYYTGDMGYTAGGELYVTGRKKDLIIVGGKNIYPQDIEAAANEISGIVPGRSVAFGLFDASLGSENVVMVCELEDGELPPHERKTLEMELRRRVLQQSDIAISDVRFVERRWLIKTSSGKISRSANRDKYLHEFSEV
jgi:fatty-acyl-CoA synthase